MAEAEGVIVCSGCSYDLRAQPAGGVCPECGEAVAAAIATGQSATARALFVVAVRVLALHFAIRGVLDGLELLWYLLSSSLMPGSYWAGMDISDLLGSFGSRILFSAIIGLVLWRYAPKLASLAITNDRPLFEGVSIGASDLIRVGFVLLGVFFTVTGLADVLAAIVEIGFGDPEMYSNHDSLAWGLVRLLCGIGLMAGPRRWFGLKLIPMAFKLAGSTPGR